MVYDFGDKEEEFNCIGETNEDTPDFLRFMQTRQSRRFVKRNGSPKRLFFINEYKSFIDRENERELKVGARIMGLEADRNVSLFGGRGDVYSPSDLGGNWLETDRSKVVKLDLGYEETLLNYLLNIMPREEMVADSSIFYKKDFDSLLGGFPIFGRGGICKHLVDFGNLEFKKPTETQKVSFERAYSELERDDYSLSLA